MKGQDIYEEQERALETMYLILNGKTAKKPTDDR
jgi:hypothetical protein